MIARIIIRNAIRILITGKWIILHSRLVDFAFSDSDMEGSPGKHLYGWTVDRNPRMIINENHIAQPLPHPILLPAYAGRRWPKAG
jgi:hypothetical protein